MFAAKRLGKELIKAKQKLPPGIELVKADDLKEWWMDIRVLGMWSMARKTAWS